MGELRMTDMARLGALRRFGRPRVDLLTGLVMLGSLAVAAGGVVALTLDGPPWRGRYAVAHAARLIDDGDYASAIRTLLGAVAAVPRERRRPAVRLRPRAAEIRLLLATALRRAGDLDGMVREYIEVRRLAAGKPLGEIARQALNERRVR